MRRLITYVMPRPFSGYNIPIAIQNTVLRDYCARNNLKYSLATTELTTSECFSMLKEVIEKNKEIDLGVASAFVFPIYDKKKLTEILNLNKFNFRIHAVLENFVMKKKDFLEWATELSAIHKIIPTYDSIN